MSRPQVDVIIVNYRSAALVGGVLSRLRSQGRWPHGRIWVVDNSSEPSHTRELRAMMGQAGGVEAVVQMTGAPATPTEAGSDLVQLSLPTNVGFGAGCNVAWAHSDAPYVLLLNPDALIDEQAVGRLAQVLQANPQLAAISPRTWWDRLGGWLLPPATPQRPWAQLKRAWASRRDPPSWASTQAERTAGLSFTQKAAASLWEVDMLSGAVLMLRRDAVQACGGLFDESFFMYFEDAQLSDRLRAGGWRLAITAEVDAVHTWRHELHKAPLMEAAKAHYLQQSGVLYRWLAPQWPRLSAMGVLGPVAHRFASGAQAADGLGPVCALSPVPSGDPAWVRAEGAWAPLNDREWDLLAPGAYWAWSPQGWMGFERL
jgi:GT2 family glycosyltransferase